MPAYPKRVIKAVGFDFELANFLSGPCAGSPRQAANCLLAELDGYPRSASGGSAIEYGRRFLPCSGSSWYIDSDHLEGNLPEHTSAWDHPSILHGAGFAHAQAALRAAQARLPPGTRLHLLANCSDGRTAWGSHLSILLTRECFEALMGRKPHQASLLATHLVTSVPYTGQGMVGAANGKSPCDYQFSQRADWFEQFADMQTMTQRPLINLRDESHTLASLARLHIIYFDMVLAPVANILKVGTTQLLLAMLEANWTAPTLCLDDPVAAASQISRDLRLRCPLRTAVRGRCMTALEIQQALADLAGQFVAAGAAQNVVPGAPQIVTLWQETLDLLRHAEAEALARRCDAWLKYLLLQRQRRRRNLSWSSAEMRMADSLFASLNPADSLFYQAARSGFVEGMPDAESLHRWANEPPEDTRAYFRAHVLRRFGDSVSSMDWSQMTFRVPTARHWTSFAEVRLPDPLRFHRTDTESLLAESTSLEELVDGAHALTLDHGSPKLLGAGHP